jgi:hypothetical protein
MEIKADMRAVKNFWNKKTLAKLDAHYERGLATLDSQLEKIENYLGRRRPRIWRQILKKRDRSGAAETP